MQHIRYNPANDPQAYLAQALQQFGQESLARRQRRQFQKGLSPTMTPMQIMQKALQSGYDPKTAIGFARLAPTAGAERGTLPWYQWPEYKDSPAAKRARGEMHRVTKPFGPSSTFQMKDDIDKRIEVIKSGVQKGPGAGKIGGPDYAQSDILNNYTQEAEAIGYRSLSAAQQRQFDALWDTKMRGQKDFEWSPKSKEVKAARSALRTGNLPAQSQTMPINPQIPAGQIQTQAEMPEESKAAKQVSDLLPSLPVELVEKINRALDSGATFQEILETPEIQPYLKK